MDLKLSKETFGTFILKILGGSALKKHHFLTKISEK